VKRVVSILIASVPLLAAAAPSWQSQALASAAPFIDKANSDWSRAIVTGNAAMLSAPYAADAVFIGPDGTAIHSKAGVRTMYGRRPAKVQVLNASIKSDGRAAADPNDVYEWGHRPADREARQDDRRAQRPLPHGVASHRKKLADHAQYCLLMDQESKRTGS